MGRNGFTSGSPAVPYGASVSSAIIRSHRALKFFPYILLTIILFSATVRAEDESASWKDKFSKLENEGKQDEAYACLLEWQKENPDDPDLFLSLFSYYVNRNSREFVLMARESAADSSLILTNQGDKSNGGNPTGKKIYQTGDVRTGLLHLDKGLKKYPDRLDMHMEKIRILGDIRDLGRQRQAILLVLALSKKNKNNWQWKDGTVPDNGREFMLENIQGHVANLIRLMRYDHARKISEEMMRLYPDVTYSYNNLGVIAYREGRDTRALELFHRAERINPQDELVLNNIARIFDHEGNIKQALLYYRKLADRTKDDKLRETAKQRIDELKQEKEKAALIQSGGSAAISSPVEGSKVR